MDYSFDRLLEPFVLSLIFLSGGGSEHAFITGCDNITGDIEQHDQLVDVVLLLNAGEKPRRLGVVLFLQRISHDRQGCPGLDIILAIIH